MLTYLVFPIKYTMYNSHEGTDSCMHRNVTQVTPSLPGVVGLRIMMFQ